MSYSKEGHENLSIFYVNSIPVNDLISGEVDSITNSNSNGVHMHQILNLLSLYNIRYLMCSKHYSSDGDGQLFHTNPANFKVLAETKDVMFVEIINNGSVDRPLKNPQLSSYFDIVRIPGFVDGNLNNVRETVQKTIALYKVNSLLYLNPRQGSQIRKEGMLNVQVCCLHIDF